MQKVRVDQTRVGSRYRWNGLLVMRTTVAGKFLVTRIVSSHLAPSRKVGQFVNLRPDIEIEKWSC